jgi:hypothetical protein
MKRQPTPNYFRPLLDFAATLKPKPGAVQHVCILHDKWCGVFQGRVCDCEPVFKDGKPGKG